MRADIKHKKVRNTGLIYELLLRQIVSDLVSSGDSSCAKVILERHFSDNSILSKEYELYGVLLESEGLSATELSGVLSTVLDRAARFDKTELERSKYALVADIKENYDIKKFFSSDIPNYRTLASIYMLLEATSDDSVSLHEVTKYRNYILNNLLTEVKKDSISEELREFVDLGSDERALSLAIMVGAYNKRYENLSEWQAKVLNEYVSLGPVAFRERINEHVGKIKESVTINKAKIGDDILNIKLSEIVSGIGSVEKRVEDDDILSVLQHIELVEELEKLPNPKQ